MSTALADSLGMFAFLAVELSLLFVIVAFLVSVLRQRIPQHTIDRVLGAGHARSYWLAALIGALTPFCSCSTIPMLKGFIRARAGFGPMMVFLFTSPLLNPIVVVLLAVTFGPRLTAIYMVAALVVS
ncbi:MAG: permease [Halioglobus sp.]|nr:permease [Halioglobus sp.]